MMKLPLARPVRPTKFFAVGLAVAGAIVCLLIVLFLTLTPLRDLYAPRVLGRSWSQAPLGVIVGDLERLRVIPANTHWNSSTLAQRRTTVELHFLETDFDCLVAVGEAAGVHIQVPVGHHGDVRGAVIIRTVDTTHPAGASAFHYQLSPR